MADEKPTTYSPYTPQEWLQTPLGEYLLQRELAYTQRVITDIFGFYALQVGLIEQDYLQSSRIQHCWHLGLNHGDCIATPEYLPFFENTFDLVVLPHVIEFSLDPHQVLRESYRILRTEGHLLLLGFNPFSLWGIKKHLWPENNFPWDGQFVGLPRLRDWLKLLGFEVIAGQLDGYIPPCQNREWLRRLEFFEAAGDRWWPIAGGLYFLHGVKRIPGVRVIKPIWQRKFRRKRALSTAAKTNTAPEFCGTQR